MKPDLQNISLILNLDSDTVLCLQNFAEVDIPKILEIENAVAVTPWSSDSFISSVNSSHVCVGLRGQKDWVAYAVFSLVAGEAELLLIGVAQRWQNKGIASLLLRKCEALIAHHAVDMFLEVRASNVPAIRLYEKLGFNNLGERKNYYPASDVSKGRREDALIYGKHISEKLCL